MFKFLVNQELCCLFNILLIILSHKDSAPFEHVLKAFYFSVCSAVFMPHAGEKEASPSACSPACSTAVRNCAGLPGLLPDRRCSWRVSHQSLLGTNPEVVLETSSGAVSDGQRAVEVLEVVAPCCAAHGRVRQQGGTVPACGDTDGGCGRRAGRPQRAAPSVVTAFLLQYLALTAMLLLPLN